MPWVHQSNHGVDKLSHIPRLCSILPLTLSGNHSKTNIWYMNNTLDPRLMHPREQIVMVIGRIYRRGLTTTSGGNISVIDDNGDIWVTPSAVDKGSLTVDDIVCVKNDGTISGRHKPLPETDWYHRPLLSV